MKQQRLIQGGNEGPQLLPHTTLPLGKPGWVVGGAIATLLAFTSTALAGPLTQWKFDQGSNQLELTVKTDQAPRYFMMAQPARIVVDLPNTQIQKPLDTQQTYDGAVRQIRISQFKPNQARIVIELSPDAVLAPGQVKLERSGKRLIVRPLIVESAPVAAAPPATRPPVPAPLTVPAIDLPTSTDAPGAPPADPTTGMVLPPALESPPRPGAEVSSPFPPESPGSVSIPIPVILPPTAAAAPEPGQPPTVADLPPASFTAPARPSVAVPPLASAPPSVPAELAPNTPFIVLPSTTPNTPFSLPRMTGSGSTAPVTPSPAASLTPANPVSPPPTVSAAPSQPEMLTMPPVQPQTVTVPPVPAPTVTVPPIQPPTVTVPPIQPPTAALPPAQPQLIKASPVEPAVVTIPPVVAPAATAPATTPAQPQPAVAVIQPEATSLPSIRIPILEFGQPLPKSDNQRVPALNGQLTPTLPPPEPGAILLPVEGPGPR